MVSLVDKGPLIKFVIGIVIAVSVVVINALLAQVAEVAVHRLSVRQR